MTDLILSTPPSNSKEPDTEVPSYAATLQECTEKRRNLHKKITAAQENPNTLPENSLAEKLGSIFGRPTEKDLARTEENNRIKKFQQELAQLPSSFPISGTLSLGSIYGTLIEYYNTLSTNAKDPDQKEYFSQRSDMYTLYLEEHIHIKHLLEKNKNLLRTFFKKKYFSLEQYKKKLAEISTIEESLSQKISHYSQVFSAHACGNSESLKKTELPARAVIQAFQGASSEIHDFENTLSQRVVEISDKHPFDTDIQKTSLTILHNIHSDRIHQWTEQVMTLSNLSNVTTFHPDENEVSPIGNIPQVSQKNIIKQRNAIITSFQKGGQEMQKEMSVYKRLANPSIFSQQGRAQIGEEFFDGLQKKGMPEWAQNILTSVEGKEAQQSITTVFKNFSHHPAFTKYNTIINRFANKDDEIYTWMKNPYEDNPEKLQKFLEEMQSAETEYLKAFYQLTSDLQKKGIGHAQIRKMITWVQNNMLLTIGAGVAATGITTAALIKALKWGGKRAAKAIAAIVAGFFSP